MTVYEPVREARVVWARTFSEQLSLHVDDIAPWLLCDPGSHHSTSPESGTGIAEQPHNTTSGPAAVPTAEAEANAARTRGQGGTKCSTPST